MHAITRERGLLCGRFKFHEWNMAQWENANISGEEQLCMNDVIQLGRERFTFL